MPDDIPLDTRVRLLVYGRLLDTARAPDAAELVDALDTPLGQVQAALHRLHDTHMLVLKPDSTDIWMANPLSAVPTDFAVEVGDRSHFANCIWDALGVPAMLDADATIRTSCPDSSEPLAVRIEAQSLVPTEGVIHFAVPARHWWDDIGYT